MQTSNVTVDLAQLEKRVEEHLAQTEAESGVEIAFGALVGIAEQTQQLQENIALLLKAIGQPALCNGCGAEIWWVVHLNGKRAPYTKAGLNHFVDCPQAQKFRKVKA